MNVPQRIHFAEKKLAFGLIFGFFTRDNQVRLLLVALALGLLSNCSSALEDSNSPSEQNPVGDRPKRVAQDLILLYEFNDSSGATISETSGHSTAGGALPIDLTIFEVSFITWLSGGLHIGGPAGISSGNATELQSAVESTEEVTIEAWLKPENATQGTPDPACIFAYAGDTTTHNFRLAQAGDSYSVDFRTTDTNNNNNNAKGQPSLLSPAGSVTAQITHVVMTWSNATGAINLYINGVWSQSLARIGKVFQGWEGTLPLRLGYELAPDGSLVNAWQGDVYLIAVYNRELTEEEITRNYQAGYDGTI